MAKLPSRSRSARPARAGPAPETKLLGAAPPSLAADGVFEGYASLFGLPDLGGDVVEPGAFRDSLSVRGAGALRMLWQHDPAEPLGRWLHVGEDGRGLRVRGRLNLAVGRAREAAALLAEGGIDGLSIGFRTVEARRDRRTGLRRLLRIDLWEISLVTFPMLPGARIAPPGPAPGVGRGASALASAIRRASARFPVHPAPR